MEHADYEAYPEAGAAQGSTAPDGAAETTAATTATAAAEDFASSLADRLDEEGVPYEVVGRTALAVSYPTAEEGVFFDVTVIFDVDGVPPQKEVVGQGGYAAAHVRLRAWDLGSFADSGRRDDAVVACNHLNNLYRWVKFSVGPEGDAVGAVDSVVNAKSGGDEVLSLLGLMTEICVDAKLAFGLVRDGLAPAFLTSAEPVVKKQVEGAAEGATAEGSAAEGAATAEGATNGSAVAPEGAAAESTPSA